MSVCNTWLNEQHRLNMCKLQVRRAWEKEKKELRIEREKNEKLRTRAKAARTELKVEDDEWRNQDNHKIDDYFTIVDE